MSVRSLVAAASSRQRFSTAGPARGRWAALAVAALLCLPLMQVGAGAASADTAPVPPTTTTTVAADALPTVQINGVVWDEVIVGNTVYAAGNFTSARPAGSPAGTNETPRADLLAYDLTTGNLITTWAPTLNGEARAIVASPDGKRIFVGGSFTQVNGQNRYRIAALDATTGALVPGWNVVADARVRSLAISGDNLYFGGIFGTISGQPRTRLAAVSASTGALLAWAPTADAEVLAMTAPAGSGKVVIGGRFASVNGNTSAYGMAALDATTGTLLPWAIGSNVKDAGNSAAIYSLNTDGTHVYGTGYTFGPGGNFEGSFVANTADGSTVLVNGCLGDTYDIYPAGQVFYTVAHAHNCGMIPNGNPEVSPRAWQRSEAFTSYPNGTNNGGSFNGQPSSEMLHWLPTLDPGTFTGETQSSWTVEGNGKYVIEGGEFLKVNGVAQQGLVRFVTSDVAPNKEGPQGGTDLTPTPVSAAPGALRLTWKAAWDRDNRRLTYKVLRGSTLAGSTVIGTFTADTAWWNRPTLAFVDTTAPGGSAQRYRIQVSDAFGNVVTGNPVDTTVPAGSVTSTAYANRVRADGASSFWRLSETSGTAGYDWVGGNDLTVNANATRGVAGAIVNDSNLATQFPGSTSGVPAVSSTAVVSPSAFTEEAWVKTTSTQGGKIIGFGNSNTGGSGSYDRQVYMTNDGRLIFGVVNVTNGTFVLITSAAGYNDGRWHHLAATYDATGMRLYVDGALVGTQSTQFTLAYYGGYWRIGGDSLNGWPNAPTSSALNGAIDDVAIYPTALSAATVAAHQQIGLGAGSNASPTAGFTATPTGLNVAVDGTSSTDTDGTVASYAWNFGDGTTGTGATTSHAYAAGGTYTITLTVTDNGGATGSTTKAVTVTAPVNQAPTASFSSGSTGLTASFDGTGSSDADGTVASYAWDFGDGSTGTGVTTTHPYAAPGTYSVKLTVTDNKGATGTVTKSVTVASATAGTTVATDAFGRTVTSGWGSADAGGAWTLSAGGSTVSVGSGDGRQSIPVGRTVTARLGSVSNQDTDLTTQVWSDAMPTGGGTYVAQTVRSTAGGDYRVKIKMLPTGGLQTSIVSVVGGTEKALTSTATPSLTYTAGAKLDIRTQAFGVSPTTIRYRVWLDGTTEPTTWQQSVTDSTAGLQAAGAIGLVNYVSSSATATAVLHFDNLSAVSL